MIGDDKRYQDVLKNGLRIAASGENIVVLGIRPTRAETGYGYIEAGSPFQGDALRVRRFTEKPDASRAAEFVRAGNYYWNSGMFLWSARTLTNALLQHLPKTASVLQQIAATFGTREFAATLARLYPDNFDWLAAHFDRLIGNSQPRQQIVKSGGDPASLKDLFEQWSVEEASFRAARQESLLYLDR